MQVPASAMKELYILPVYQHRSLIAFPIRLIELDSSAKSQL